MAFTALTWAATLVAPAKAADVDFDQVRLILSDKCYHCHGPDEATREADLRLDTQAGALADLGGYAAIVPGDPAASAIVERIESDDPDTQMPPPDSKISLSEEEKATLREWIEAGAEWSQHWSFVAPTQPHVPRDESGWARNPIDHFVRKRAIDAGLHLNPEASPRTLVRRLTLDLTGLPPTRSEIERFLSDSQPGAYERLVDRLLASPEYGQRMAWDWLDAARYADTDGFQGDPERSMWPWRDWLVNALNENMRFDQFTIQMLAGDLLPDTTPEQILASGFNRNHMFNGEGGRIAEETRVENVFDRAETTSTVWLGLTMTCCRCHDHKYDPISQREYFQLYAFFDNTSETGRSGRGKTAPVLNYLPPDLRAKKQKLESELATVRAAEASAASQTNDKSCDDESCFEEDKAEDVEESAQVKLLLGELAALEKRSAKVMVMDDLPAKKRRKTFILERGAYDKPTEQSVTPAIPSALPQLEFDSRGRDGSGDELPSRLDLARWLVSPDHPLTARVTVNRYWQAFFGRGIVSSTEDFGSQGSRPTHPELLDWLALSFIESGWDVKALHRLIVTSATYRQSAVVSKEALEADPDNLWLARSPRYRLPAWMLRDQALAAGGLLDRQFGGPSVKPYQPDGIWAEATFGKIKYKPDSGSKLFRRSMYVFWRRIVGPTMFFDGAKRQTCEVKPSRTNTPLHALTTLNETAFVESARGLASQVLRQHDEPAQRCEQAYHTATGRLPSKRELDVLVTRLETLVDDYSGDTASAEALLSVGQSPPLVTESPAKAAALTALCTMILNLDEVLTRP
ncbi:MAG: DUF1553 domain-containing protein [Aureliella sp.]